MQSRYVLPRAAYTLASGRYAASSRWLASNALYLAQVAEAGR
jgi:hypothetical protein